MSGQPNTVSQAWPTRPIIYEINAWVWLADLSHRLGRPVALDTVPADEWDQFTEVGVDAVWLMGVWERSPLGARIARDEPSLLAAYCQALPDFTPEDVVGSPYCVHRYLVDDQLGGPAGLAVARQALAQRGIKLILDFVPNHVALDHPWVHTHPEYFIQGNASDLSQAPHSFAQVNGHVLAFGRDPYFPAWTDVAQLNAFDPALRSAAIQTLQGIADQCDGVRCDMAMLLLNNVFERTWGGRAGPLPSTEYWSEVLAAVRRTHPDMLFMAEAYWDLEWTLQQLGFDYCYDKRLYDRLLQSTPEGVRQHLLADLTYQEKLVRFLENHDEPRAAAVFIPDRERAAAIATYTLPGARLFHEGQFEGRRVRLTVQLARRPDEPLDQQLHSFYRTLLQVMNAPALRQGEWRLCELTGWPDNNSERNLVAWCWRHQEERWLVVVNLSESPAQGRVRWPWLDLEGHTLQLSDAFSGEIFEREGGEMQDLGMYVARDGWGYHVLRF